MSTDISEPVFEDGRTLAEVQAETSRVRYFADHDVIHDRETSKHVYAEDAARELNALLEENERLRAEKASQLAQLRIQRDLAHYQRDKVRELLREALDIATMALDGRSAQDEVKARRILSMMREAEL